MQKIEISSTHTSSVHCPFCGSKILHPDEGFVDETTRCSHVLLLATDDGIEYSSDSISLTEESKESGDIDSEIDTIDFPNALKLSLHTAAPSFYGLYAVLAPIFNETT